MKIIEKNIKAKIYNHQEWIEQTNPKVLKQVYSQKLIDAGFKILKYDDYLFSNNGFTCFWLLAESHLAIHTFPEENTSYIEISSCNEQMLYNFVNS